MRNQTRSPRSYWVPALVFVLAVLGIALWAAMRWNNSGPWVAPADAKSVANPVPPSTQNLAAAKPIYDDRCAHCHGDKGSGDGPDASMYKTPPGVLSDTRIVGAETDGEIFWKITNGRRPMPGFAKELTAEQRWQLVDFIRSLAKPSS